MATDNVINALNLQGSRRSHFLDILRDTEVLCHGSSYNRHNYLVRSDSGTVWLINTPSHDDPYRDPKLASPFYVVKSLDSPMNRQGIVGDYQATCDHCPNPNHGILPCSWFGQNSSK